MRHMVLTMLALLLSIALQANEIYDIVPLPQDIRLQKGQPFILDGNVQILTASDLQREALFLRDYIREQTGLELAVTDRHNRKVRTIALTVSPSVTHPEGYRLDVSKDGINILGGSSAGVFYGIQTLRKSLGIAKSQGLVFLGGACIWIVPDISSLLPLLRSSSICLLCTI